jgi:uncharacterized protein (TIGR03435 family)
MIGPATIIIGANTEHQRVKYQQRSMDDFVRNPGYSIATSHGLRPSQGDPVPHVQDTTGLTGTYTFTFEYSCPSCDRRPGAADDPGSGFPELFKAIRQQLGLRLDKTADVALDVIVVDKADKTPTEN